MKARYHFSLLIYLVTALECASEVEDSPWTWTCEGNDTKCMKRGIETAGTGLDVSVELCHLLCNKDDLIWPKPTGDMKLNNLISTINVNEIYVQILNPGKSDDLMMKAFERFKKHLTNATPAQLSARSHGYSLTVYLVNQNPDLIDFSLEFDESYRLRVTSDGNVNVTITGANFFGIRHGMETLTQLVFYYVDGNLLTILKNVNISDKPVYPYRGILLDTARNYFTVDSIKATIDAMAAVKLNTFHWHITDSQSFPFVSASRPNLTKYGTYSPTKNYTREVIRNLVHYGHVRGVRVLPEFDAPAHVGEGWQDTNLTVCFKAEPWRQYCVEPPCGQLNPTRDALYQYLENIYTDMADAFANPGIFHMGGDDVSEKCWNSSAEIQQFMIRNGWDLEKSSFLKLWNYFQVKAQDKAYKAFGKRLPLILRTSTLTEYTNVQNFLNNTDYIIQVTTAASDPQIRGLLQKGYRLIMSNHDALYFNCGFGRGKNWCSSYIDWQKVYDNSPAAIALEYKNQILGGEAVLWSERVDSGTLDGRLWPRAAALAERLWSEPSTTWQNAQYRFQNVRERLIRMGINAEPLEPEWCYQNEGYC